MGRVATSDSTPQYSPRSHPTNGQSCGYFSELNCTFQNQAVVIRITRRDMTDEGCDRLKGECEYIALQGERRHLL